MAGEGPEGTIEAEDRLPWLEAVEEDGAEGGPSVAKLIGAIVVGLVAIGLIVGGLFWLGNRNRESGTGELIAAPEGDYKVRPDDPGGMNVEGEGDTAFAASEGAVPQGQLDTRKVPPAPVAPPKAAPAPAPTPATDRPSERSTASREAQPKAEAPARAGEGGTIQLGAFSSQASANRAWTALSKRFRYLAPLGHSIVPVESGGRTLYRLRASGAGAADICRRLRVAGEDCTIIG